MVEHAAGLPATTIASGLRSELQPQKAAPGSNMRASEQLSSANTCHLFNREVRIQHLQSGLYLEVPTKEPEPGLRVVASKRKKKLAHKNQQVFTINTAGYIHARVDDFYVLDTAHGVDGNVIKLRKSLEGIDNESEQVAAIGDRDKHAQQWVLRADTEHGLAKENRVYIQCLRDPNLVLDIVPEETNVPGIFLLSLRERNLFSDMQLWVIKPVHYTL